MLSALALSEVETAAIALLERADQCPTQRPAMVRMVRELLGTPPLQADLPGDESLLVCAAGWRIVVRRGTSKQRADWLMGHELAHWWLERECCGVKFGRHLEAACDALGAALVLPAERLRRTVAEHGHNIAQLATALGVAQSLVLLRLGEVLGVPTALVRHRNSIITRGSCLCWPGGTELRRIARNGRAPAGLRVVRIEDESNHIGVLAA